MSTSRTFLCLTCYFKGASFLQACKAAGNTVYLVTSKRLEHDPWPWDSIDEVFYMQEDDQGNWRDADLLQGLAFLMRSRQIDRIIALDDFDVERAAHLREIFRIPGMGDTTARHFRDKLAMRIQARDHDIPVPAFTPVFNDAAVRQFTETVPGPWFIKPRGEASATGIQKVEHIDALWSALEKLGDQRHHYLLEAFVSGDVYHVDALSFRGDTRFTRCSRYLDPPFEVAHHGGVFRTRMLQPDDPDYIALEALNKRLLEAFGMKHSPSHTEYIKHGDTFYFLETSARVGGAHIAEMVEAASGVNLWHEWARIETALLLDTPYTWPKPATDLAAAIISLSKFEHPDTASFSDPEIVWRMDKPYHIGFILKSADARRLDALLDTYAQRIRQDYHAAVPAPERSSH